MRLISYYCEFRGTPPLFSDTSICHSCFGPVPISRSSHSSSRAAPPVPFRPFGAPRYHKPGHYALPHPPTAVGRLYAPGRARTAAPGTADRPCGPPRAISVARRRRIVASVFSIPARTGPRASATARAACSRSARLCARGAFTWCGGRRISAPPRFRSPPSLPLRGSPRATKP